MSAEPFRRRAVVGLVAAGLLSFASAVFWSLAGADVTEASSARADSFSRSALGHHAFVALLRELGIPVTVSRFASAGKAGESALLVLAEPQADQRVSARQMVQEARRVLVVLPKRKGQEDRSREGWISDATLLYLREVDRLIVPVLGVGGHVKRPATTSGWDGAAPPSLEQPQLLDALRLVPLISCDQGVLFGRIQSSSGTTYVLSDPDLISNHGLGRGANAAVAYRAVQLALGGCDAVVVDETLHGFRREPSLYRSLFEFPLLPVTLQVLLAVAALVWATMGRFGAPHPVAPALEPGKAFLVDHTASLLRYAGRPGDALRRFLRMAEADVRLAVHAPASLDDVAARAWLDRYGEERGVGLLLDDLQAEVAVASRRGREGEKMLAIANRIWEWKEKMIHGSVRDR